jgi:metallo-beta-lactamase class B
VPEQLRIVAIVAILLAFPQITAAGTAQARIGLDAAAQWPGYASLCDLESRIRNVNVPRSAANDNPGSTRQRQRSREPSGRVERNPLPPLQVFDNLYFLGTRSVSAWLYGTDGGYILIDGLNSDEEAKRFILGGMEMLGLDASDLKGILVTHGHGDHYGGADYIAEHLDIDIMMTQADWTLAQSLGTHPRFGPPPESAVVVEDGQTIEFGDSALVIHVTPGHTPGTISPVFPVYDNGTRHIAMLWGGTGFNFGPNPEIFQQYADSAARMRVVSENAGVDVFLSNHSRRDGTAEMMEALAERKPGEPHPFVLGDEGYSLFTVLEQCALAQAERFRLEGSD